MRGRKSDTDHRAWVKDRLYELVMGYDRDGAWVDGVVNFRDDDVDFARLADGVLEMFPSSTGPVLAECDDCGALTLEAHQGFHGRWHDRDVTR